MGAGASAGVAAAIKTGSVDDVKETLKALSPEDRAKLMSALADVPSKAVLYYMPIAGRGELIRMIAAVGGIELEEVNDMSGVDKASFGSPGASPLLQHGDLKMTQSAAIESYMLLISPIFSALTPAQRAKDFQMCSIKEDLLAGTAGIIFDPEKKAKANEELVKVLDKWMPVIEGLCPSDGFINGQSFPTGADLAVVNMFYKSFMPFGATFKCAGMKLDSELSKYPKINALVARTVAHKLVAAYFETAKMTEANPFGM